MNEFRRRHDSGQAFPINGSGVRAKDFEHAAAGDAARQAVAAGGRTISVGDVVTWKGVDSKSLGTPKGIFRDMSMKVTEIGRGKVYTKVTGTVLTSDHSRIPVGSTVTFRHYKDEGPDENGYGHGQVFVNGKNVDPYDTYNQDLDDGYD